MIEFRFREGVVDGTATLFTLAENSHQEFIISLNNAELKAKCDLKSLKNNFYTAIAPVWIELNESCLNSLREQGEVTLALYVPSSENQIKETKIVMVDPTEDIQEVTENYGTLVGVLKLRRSNG